MKRSVKDPKRTRTSNRPAPAAKEKDHSRPSAWKQLPPELEPNEKRSNEVRLRQDVPEEFREAFPNELSAERPQTTNWSQAEDRGEDLATLRDPFMQQPERDTEIPPELIQERAYRLYEQRGQNPGDTLADWFEAERQIRGEMPKRHNTGAI